MRERRSLENWLSLSGPLAAVFYFLHVFYGTRLYPGYEWARQAVSDLTAADAPSYMVASKYAAVYGTLACLCCTVACLLIRDAERKALRIGVYSYAAMNWVSYLGYTFFPLSSAGYAGTFQDVMHFYVVTISVVALSILSLSLIIVGGFRSRTDKYLPTAAALALASMFVGSIGMGAAPGRLFGLMERFSVFSVVLFTGVLGAYGFARCQKGRSGVLK
jgi:hypothetical membrane protein